MLLVSSRCTAASVFPSCPWDCPGAATQRLQNAREAARVVSLGGDWAEVRQQLVRACGLQVVQATSHCFADYNHVDCCTMVAQNTHNTNEQSRVAGMHPVNQLGPHITAASVRTRGEGGSWCTCQLQSPFDVCHRQFGAAAAFKLVWCEGGRLAALVDDAGNLLNSGTPQGRADSIPEYGGQQARSSAWRVLLASPNRTMAERWADACEAARRIEDARVTANSPPPSPSSRDGSPSAQHAETRRHDEL